MTRFAGTFGLIGAVLVLLAGCPQSGTTAIPGTSGSATTGESTRGVATAPPPATDDLTQQFPSCTEPVDADAWREEMLLLVNQVREDLGVGPVVWSDTLAAMATQFACEMIEYDFFDHVNPVTGSTLDLRADDFGYDFSVVGENLAAGQRTPEEAFAAWMDSVGHRENILDPRFTELGVGVRSGGRYQHYWVQEFGRPPLRSPPLLRP